MIAPALADSANMQAAFDSGAFKEAARLGEAEDNSPALAFAARSLLAGAGFTDDLGSRDQSVEGALRDAEAALDRDHSNVEAHLQLAIALGYEARRVGPERAHAIGLAVRAKKSIDAALRLDPRNPWAYAVLGAWNLEIVLRGGLAGRALYGATRAAGIAAYDRAVALDPANGLLQYERALELLSLDPDHLKITAERGLAAAIATVPTTYVERAVATRATELENALAAGDRQKLAALLAHLRGNYEEASAFYRAWP